MPKPLLVTAMLVDADFTGTTREQGTLSGDELPRIFRATLQGRAVKLGSVNYNPKKMVRLQRQPVHLSLLRVLPRTQLHHPLDLIMCIPKLTPVPVPCLLL